MVLGALEGLTTIVVAVKVPVTEVSSGLLSGIMRDFGLQAFRLGEVSLSRAWCYVHGISVARKELVHLYHRLHVHHNQPCQYSTFINLNRYFYAKQTALRLHQHCIRLVSEVSY